MSPNRRIWSAKKQQETVERSGPLYADMAGSASCRAIPRAVRRGDRPAPVGSHFLHRPQPPALRPGDRLALLPTVDLELLSKIGHSWAILAERRIGAITTFTIRLPTQASWNAV